jgi:hypothetical protein
MKSQNLVISIIIIILLLGAGYYFIKKDNVVTNPAENDNAPVATSLKTFTEKNNTFSFDYDPTFEVKETDSGAEINIPKSFMPDTNFSDSRFTVSKDYTTSGITNCIVATNGEVDSGKATIDGFPFEKFTLNDAGAGNFYETTSYRGIVDGDCYSIGYTIHSTNIANYPPEAGIKEFNKAKIVSVFESIVNSFKFLVNSD